ncbi:MAG: lytic transglycosylase domain-containing protein [Anaerolineae bacterium]|nr:lytic transglycosylase domain-containing protein [Anaerolineae bacterium]
MNLAPIQDLFLKPLLAQWAGRIARSLDGKPATTGSTTSAKGDFDALIVAASARHGLSADLVRAVVKAESNFNPNAISSAGAKGLMQLMDETARGLGVRDSFDPTQNVEAGVTFLRQMLDRYGNVSLALAAYNAGPGAVDRYGGIPPYAETQRYVKRVLELCEHEWEA